MLITELFLEKSNDNTNDNTKTVDHINRIKMIIK